VKTTQVFPVSIDVILDSLAEFIIIGAATGALAGFLASKILKTSRRWLLMDAFLGVFGFYAGFGLLIHMPWEYHWPRDTVIAILIAATFPVLHEYYRSRQSQKSAK
jgi:uncharacterized membrane protein YeaQ/YmgE (transglycosylase-associated protein family)